MKQQNLRRLQAAAASILWRFHMNAKEYLSQAFLIDKRINSKIEQLDNLRVISRMTNRQISDMPGSPNRNTHKLEDTVIKIIELEAEIDSDIDALVDLKADITHRIKQINCPEYQLVLELRNLCFKSWEEIAMQMGYDVRHVFRLHGEALKTISDISDLE